MSNLQPTIYEHCAVPGLIEIVPISEQALEDLIAEDPEAIVPRFALANLRLIAGDYQSSVEEFERILALDSTSVGARCNLGVARFAIGNLEQAVSEFLQVILLEKTHTVSHLYLGRCYQLQGRVPQAISALERVLELDPSSLAAHSLLAVAYESLGNKKEADKHYEALRTLEPDNLKAEIGLGLNYFIAGNCAYEQGDIVKALSIWGEGYQRYPRAFQVDKEIANEMRRVAENYRLRRQLVLARRAYRQSSAIDGSAYRLFLEFYFSLGLHPEFYCAKEELSLEIDKWQKETDLRGVYPYARFKLGVLQTYSGQFQPALENFVFCQDHMPVSKARSFQLAEVIRFTKQLCRERGVGKLAVNLSSEDEWEACGFTDVFTRDSWRKTGLTPNEALLWKEKGFTASQSEKWQLAELTINEAIAWKNLGFIDPKIARRWKKGGFSPEEASQWQAIFPGTLEQAVQFYQAGFKTPGEASQWLEVFNVPFSAAPWNELGFSPEETRSWLEKGITDPFEAKRQKLADELAYASIKVSEGNDSEES